MATVLVVVDAPAVVAPADNADAPDGVDVDATQSTDTGNVTV